MSANDVAIQKLASQLADDCPDASVSIDKPKSAGGIWFLDIWRDGHSVNVQWQAKRGFRVSSSANGSAKVIQLDEDQDAKGS